MLLLKKISQKEYSTIPEFNNHTRRVPKEILAVSNSFCYDTQKQESLSKVVGELMYVESTDARYEKLLNDYIETKQIVCIDKKAARYSTSSKHKYSFPREIEEMIRDSDHKKDKTLFVKASFSDFMDDVTKLGNKRAITTLITRHSLKLGKPHFAQLHELCGSCIENDAQFRVKSIDSVKGLDADTCVIILSPNTLRYLSKDKLSKANRFNKEWKKIYVALTRTKKRLVLALDHDLLAGFDMGAVRDSIGALGFTYHD